MSNVKNLGRFLLPILLLFGYAIGVLSSLGPHVGLIFERISSNHQPFYEWSDIVWSPDQLEAAFARQIFRFDGSTNQHIFLVDLEENSIEIISLDETPEWLDVKPEWIVIKKDLVQTNYMESNSPNNQKNVTVRLQNYVSIPEVIIREVSTGEELRLLPLLKLEDLNCPSVRWENQMVKITATFSNSPANENGISIPVRLYYNVNSETEPIEIQPSATQQLALDSGQKKQITWQFLPTPLEPSSHIRNYEFYVESRDFLEMTNMSELLGNCEVGISSVNITFWYIFTLISGLIFSFLLIKNVREARGIMSNYLLVWSVSGGLFILGNLWISFVFWGVLFQ